MLDFGIETTRDAETPEAKARWFYSLPLEQRMEVFSEMTEMIMAIQPRIADRRDVTKAKGPVQVLELPRG